MSLTSTSPEHVHTPPHWHRSWLRLTTLSVIPNELILRSLFSRNWPNSHRATSSSVRSPSRPSWRWPPSAPETPPGPRFTRASPSRTTQRRSRASTVKSCPASAATSTTTWAPPTRCTSRTTSRCSTSSSRPPSGCSGAASKTPISLWVYERETLNR